MKYIILLAFLFICTLGGFAQPVMKISSGTDVILNDGTHLVLYNSDLENEGLIDALSPDVTVTFSGDSNTDLIAFDDIEFYNLRINKSESASVLLNTDILVENNIDMTSGVFDLKGFLVTLDGGQIINENQNNYITGSSGRIEYISILNSPSSVNPGNLGVEITSTQNLGQTVIRRSHKVQTSNDGGYGIKRYFDINPVNNSGLDATLRMYYFDHELNGIPESELGLYRSADNGNTWNWIGFDVLNAAENYIQKTNIDAFSRWTLGSQTNAPLPVELGFFSAAAEKNHNLLKWVTLTEDNVDRFDIQKLKGTTWETIGRINAIGFSNEEQAYQFADYDFIGQDYYRLRIKDFDGQETLSKVIVVSRDLKEDIALKIYPNPAKDLLYLELPADVRDYQIRVFNTIGQELISHTRNSESINLSKLPNGSYVLEVQTDTFYTVTKFNKQQ
jgi:hypothetical protein